MNKHDNMFGDHNLTESGRFDGWKRAPLDMGLGSKKMIFFRCPKCETVNRVSKSTFSLECRNCHKYIRVSDCKEVKHNEETYEATKHQGKIVTPEHMEMRRTMENKAEAYRNGKRK